MVVALSGGVGAARLLSGMIRVTDPREITAVVNTGDDLELHGLHISPDIDTVVYTLAGMDNKETGWGLAGDTWHVMDALEELGGEDWFRLGDRDLATHLYRTQRLARGATLAEVTRELASRRWVVVRVLPMSNDPVRTRLTLAGSGPSASGTYEVAFQHYFVRLRHEVAVRAVRYEGADDAQPAPGVEDAIAEAERIVICPSNPVVSIGPILAVPGIFAAVAARRSDVVAVSPIIAGKALKGPAARLMSELGHESSVVGVAKLYAAFCGTLVIDELDAARAAEVEALGVRCVVAPTVMRSPQEAAALARVVLEAGG